MTDSRENVLHAAKQDVLGLIHERLAHAGGYSWSSQNSIVF
jgi:hypothetical protein